MTSWNPQANELFLKALALPTAEERQKCLDDGCAGDAALRAEVEALLEASARADKFLESPAGTQVATIDHPLVTDRPGTVVGPYKLLEQIGEGGFGIVFMAEQQHPVRRRVALKVLKAGMDTRQVVARFEAERQALALMDHPNIAKVFDGGATASGRPYFVMELVKGVPITDFCDQDHLTPRQRLELFLLVCSAVQHAHQKGIIHRDLKPSNVLVTVYDTTPVVKVIDFGVAKALGQELTEKTLFTGFAQMIGTPLYMSPEQAGQSGLDIDTRGDIYSLGVLLYELLTGTTPFTRERFRKADPDEIRRIIREEEPPRPSTRLSESKDTMPSVSARRQTEPAKLARLVRGELDWVVMKALEKDRNRRYETASAFAADVRRYLADEPVQACPPSALYRLRKFARRNKAASFVSLAGLLAVAVLATSTALTARALRSETEAKGQLADTLERERQDAYFQRITLAYHALSADDLGRALKLLRECPEDLRRWEWYYLRRLCQVEPVILRDKVEVNSLAFSPDGQSIAGACGDGVIKIWNSKTGKVIQRLDTHSGPVFSVAFHPHGKHLASCGRDRHVKVWDLTTQEIVFDGPSSAVHNTGTAYAVAFSADGRLLAVGNAGTVTVWDWRSRRIRHSFGDHDKRAITVAFSRYGRRLASGGWSGKLSLWDPEAGGEPLCTFPDSRQARHPVAALAFSPDGGRLATANFARSVDVWDTTTGERLLRLPHSGLVPGVAYSLPDGLRLASAGEDKTVHIWDAETGREVLALHGHKGYCGCVAYSPDGFRLASASRDGTIRIWDATPLQDHERQETLTFTRHTDEVWSVAVSPDGQRIASGGWGSKPVKVWDVRTGQVYGEFPHRTDFVFCVDWHPDGQRVASAGLYGQFMTVKVWDARTGEEIYRLPVHLGEPEIFAAAFSPDGRYLVTGRHNGAVQVWDAQTGKEVGPLGVPAGSPIRAVVFSPKGGHLATVSGNGMVKLWDATRLGEKQLQPRLGPRAWVPGQCSNMAFSPDGRRLATGGEKHTVKIWDVQTNELLQTLEGQKGDVYTVAFSPDGRWVAAGGEGSTVRVWDSHTSTLLRSFRGHTGLVSSLAFAAGPDGLRLVSGSRDHKVKVWDVTHLDEVPGRPR
jgi:WD40 repeat protein/serine/threonine protein kinase